MIGSHIDLQEQQCCKITYGSVQLYLNKSRVSNLIPIMGNDQHTTDKITRRHKQRRLYVVSVTNVRMSFNIVHALKRNKVIFSCQYSEFFSTQHRKPERVNEKILRTNTLRQRVKPCQMKFIFVLLKIQVFWDVTPRRLVNSYPCYVGSQYLHLQSQRIKTLHLSDCH